MDSTNGAHEKQISASRFVFRLFLVLLVEDGGVHEFNCFDSAARRKHTYQWIILDIAVQSYTYSCLRGVRADDNRELFRDLDVRLEQC